MYKRRQCSLGYRVILFRSGGLGDILLTLPLIKKLEDLFKEMIICIPSKYHFLLQQFSPKAQLNDLDEGDEEIMKYADGSEVLCFWNDPQWIIKWKSAGTSRVRVFDSRPSSGDHFSKSLIDQFGEPVDRIELDKPWLKLDEGSIHRHSENLWIHPGSGSHKKNQPLSEYILFARNWLQKSPTGRIFFSFGEADLNLEKEFSQQTFSKNSHVGSKIFSSLEDFYLTLMKHGGIFAGNDSGPSHMAAMLGIETHVWFRTTSPRVWAPLGPSVKVYQTDSVPSKIL
ncbi:MAG: glycosyltransferase family 9 protein [Verrucomicrobiota bacterium]|nr:glycosyltransferase family 9 protein [Verrucomicrobiota bacterium]